MKRQLTCGRCAPAGVCAYGSSSSLLAWAGRLVVPKSVSTDIVPHHRLENSFSPVGITAYDLGREAAVAPLDRGRISTSSQPIDEDVRLTTQFVGDHRRMAGDRGYNGDVDATTLHGFDQVAEIAVAGK